MLQANWPQEVDRDTLETEAATHSRDQWGLPGSYQVKTDPKMEKKKKKKWSGTDRRQKEKKKRKNLTCLEIQAVLEKFKRKKKKWEGKTDDATLGPSQGEAADRRPQTPFPPASSYQPETETTNHSFQWLHV